MPRSGAREPEGAEVDPTDVDAGPFLTSVEGGRTLDEEEECAGPGPAVDFAVMDDGCEELPDGPAALTFAFRSTSWAALMAVTVMGASDDEQRMGRMSVEH